MWALKLFLVCCIWWQCVSLLIHFRLARLLSIIVHVPLRTATSLQQILTNWAEKKKKKLLLFDKRDAESETFRQVRDTRRHLEVKSSASRSGMLFIRIKYLYRHITLPLRTELRLNQSVRFPSFQTGLQLTSSIQGAASFNKSNHFITQMWIIIVLLQPRLWYNYPWYTV